MASRRTYTEYIQNGRSYLPWQATVMFEVLLSQEHEVHICLIKDRVDKYLGKDKAASYISSACATLVEKGWLSNPYRGVYRVTPAGRRLWEKVLDSYLKQSATVHGNLLVMPKRKSA